MGQSLWDSLRDTIETNNSQTKVTENALLQQAAEVQNGEQPYTLQNTHSVHGIPGPNIQPYCLIPTPEGYVSAL